MRSARHPADIVVGVGASAGGLEAMLLFFGQVKANGRMAYVVAQHMAHGAHTELVVRVIQRESALPVCVGAPGQVLEPDCVYVIPADHDGVVQDGALVLRPPAPQRVSTPSVNVLLESIASQQGAQGYAVVLSGAGWDGARGCSAVQRAGGTVLVQDHEEASFPSMPDAVLEAGCHARRMRAGQMGPWLARKLQGLDVDVPELPQSPEVIGDAQEPGARSPASKDVLTNPGADLLPDAPPREDLRAVMARVLEVTGIDFSEYREETLLRRLQSRRTLLSLDRASYEAMLMRDRREAERLQRLFLVSLSSFWRDRDCFEALGRALAPRWVEQPVEAPIRVWVPGCASGEEVYTLAALIADAMERGGLRRPIEVIGTDLNVDALQIARLGEYPEKSFRESPSGWAERWFSQHAQTFRVRPELAALVRFELADIETGPPAGWETTGLDLISCRNLLIYFQPSKQGRLLALFHRSLRPDGLLLIGPSENLGISAQASFRALDAERRIFVRRA